MKKLMIASALLLLSLCAFADIGMETTETGEGELVIYRLADNAAARYRLYVDGQYVAKPKAHAVVRLKLSAGEHLIAVNDRARTHLKVSVRDGLTTFVHQVISRDGAKVSMAETAPNQQEKVELVRYAPLTVVNR